MQTMKDEMYLARDRDNGLFLFQEKPERDADSGFWCSDDGFLCIDENLFSELSWDDEPMHVRISIEGII